MAQKSDGNYKKPMRVLFLDTETNGLPKNRYASPKMVEAWPAIVQLAWQVWDISVGKVPVKHYDSMFYVKPMPGQVWNTEAAAIHGLTEDMAQRNGYNIAHIMSSFTADAAECDVVVAHNMAFDKNVLWATSYRIGIDPQIWWPEKEVCTMLETVAICKIQSTSKFATAKDPYKWPKLAEVWTTLFHEPVPTGLHDARQDVAVMVACFHALLERRLLVLEDKATSCRFTDFFRHVLAVLEP